MAQLSGDEFSRLHQELGDNGGFTVNPSTGKALTSGISVATEGNELRLAAQDTTPGGLAQYHGDSGNQERFARGASFGGWRDNKSGDDFIDTPTVYPNSPGGQSRARNHMLKSNQIAAFELSGFNTLVNPFHPENKSLDVVSSDDSPSQQQMWRDMPRNVSGGQKRAPREGESFS